MISADFHLHTAHSEDSDTPMEQQIEAGISAGLKIMCFTEHMDKDWPKDDGIKKGGAPRDKDIFLLDTDAYYKHCMECRDKYSGRIDIQNTFKHSPLLLLFSPRRILYAGILVVKTNLTLSFVL